MPEQMPPAELAAPVQNPPAIVQPTPAKSSRSKAASTDEKLPAKTKKKRVRKNKGVTSGRGSSRRQPNAGTPLQLARQNSAFELSLTGASHRAIAEALHVSRDTVGRDIALEAQRRAKEMPDERFIGTRRQVALLDLLENKLLSPYMARKDEATGKAIAPIDMPPNVVAEIRKLEERRALLLGLDAPKQIHVKGDRSGIDPANNPMMGLSRDEQVRLLRRYADYRRGANEGSIPNVTGTATIEGEAIAS